MGGSPEDGDDAGVASKVALAVLAFAIAATGLAVPTRVAVSPTVTAGAQLFVGGLIVATALVHLLADAAQADAGEDAFPWATALAGAGYLGMLALELLAHDAAKRHAAAAPTYCEIGARHRDDDDDLVDDARAVNVVALASPSSPHAGVIATEVPARRHQQHAEHADVVATLALAVHSVGDGVAIGVQETRAELSAVTAAILVHKLFAAYALGTLLARRTAGLSARSRRRRLVYAGVFALATPLAILLSVGLTQTSLELRRGAEGAAVVDDPEPPAAADPGGRGTGVDRATALCAGSLLYVGIHEIIQPNLDVDLEDADAALGAPAKIGLLVTGYAVMALLARWV